MFGLGVNKRRLNNGANSDDTSFGALFSGISTGPAVPVSLCFIVAFLAMAFLVFVFVFESVEHRYPWDDKDAALTGWRTRERPLVFVHMKKAGGTTLCHLAKTNGERMLAASWDHNCNFPNDGPLVNWGLVEPRFETCWERVDLIAERGVTFNCIEHFLDGDSVCSQDLLYFTILREPIERLKSYARYAQINGSTLVDWATGSNQMLGHYHQVDNYYVRMLCGRSTFEQPRGSIGLREYHRARRVLAQFHRVLLVEHLDEDLPALCRELDWRIPNEPAEVANPSTADNRARYFLTEEQTKELARANEWDLLLYQSVVEARQHPAHTSHKTIDVTQD